MCYKVSAQKYVSLLLLTYSVQMRSKEFYYPVFSFTNVLISNDLLERKRDLFFGNWFLFYKKGDT